MYNTKQYIYNLLSTDATILSIVSSSDNIYFGYPASFQTLPVIAYMEDNNLPTDWADNAPYSWESYVTIDVYTSKSTSTTALAQAVGDLLIANLYAVTLFSDVFDPDQNIQHKVIKATRKFTVYDF
jgi:hypothetical protein